MDKNMDYARLRLLKPGDCLIDCLGSTRLRVERPNMHDDVIKWKIFHVTGPLCGEFTGPGGFHTQRPVTRSFDVFFDLRLNKWLSKQPWGWWFETTSWSLWLNVMEIRYIARTCWRHHMDKPYWTNDDFISWTHGNECWWNLNRRFHSTKCP